MANTGLKNEAFISELLTSGSLVIKTKNESGVHIFSGSVIDDGVVSGKLTKPKYNEDELVRSIDTVIDELLPIDIPQGPEMVLKVIYDAALAEIALRDETIKAQSAVILDLRTKVSELEIVSQSLRVEIDGKELALAVSQNETQVANSKVASSINDLSIAIQKATAESIQRISLFARNQSLEQEVDSLREELFGKTNEIAKGNNVGTNISAEIVVKNESSYGGLKYRARANESKEEWVNGPDIKITNFTDTETVTVTFSISGSEIDGLFNKPSQITLQPKTDKTISVTHNINTIRDRRPKNSIGTTGDTEYTGELIIKTNKGDELKFPLKLRKYRGNE